MNQELTNMLALACGVPASARLEALMERINDLEADTYARAVKRVLADKRKRLIAAGRIKPACVSPERLAWRERQVRDAQ